MYVSSLCLAKLDSSLDAIQVIGAQRDIHCVTEHRRHSYAIAKPVRLCGHTLVGLDNNTGEDKATISSNKRNMSSPVFMSRLNSCSIGEMLSPVYALTSKPVSVGTTLFPDTATEVRVM